MVLPSLVLGITRIWQDCFVQYQDTVTEWDIGSLCWQPANSVGSQECVVSEVGKHPNFTFDVARMYNPLKTGSKYGFQG